MGEALCRRRLRLVLSLGAVLILLSAVPLPVKAETVGAVYTMDERPRRQLRPGLRPRCGWQLDGRGTFPTGGLGTGGREPDFGLGNAGALVLSDDETVAVRGQSGQR